MTSPVRRLLFPATLALAIAVTLMPLWSARHLPAVDAPQHLFLVHVLRALQDPASAYHASYETGLRFTYVTFHGGTTLLAAWFGEEAALRIWLSLVLGAVPLAVLALLRAFGRNPWLALLACPLVYTDGFYWGLFGFQSALAPALACLAWCARTLQQPAGERHWAFFFGGAAALLVLTHVAALPLPLLGVAFLLLSTRSDARRRRRVLLASLPALALLAAWLFFGVQRNRDIDLGKHWSGTGSLLDAENYAFDPIPTRARVLLALLANGFRGGADLWPVLAWLALVVLAVVLAALLAARQGRAGHGAPARDLRPLGLLALSLACYFCLPTDVSGYMYLIHGRYSQLAALCAIPAIPRLGGRAGAALAALAAALALASGLQLTALFRRFDREAEPFESVAARLPRSSRVMHLVVDGESRVATHSVYLHYAALAALRCDGVPSFSLAQDPSFLVNYRAGAHPPAPKWEWRPSRFTWEDHARHYDHYLVRGAAPAELFGEHTGDVQIVAQEDSWTLLRRRSP
jgi:hypothetical protein